MGSPERQGSQIEGFLARNGTRLARAVGGALVVGVLAAAVHPAEARSHFRHHSHHSSGSHIGGGPSWFSWSNPFSHSQSSGSWFWPSSEPSTVDQTVDEAKKVVEDARPGAPTIEDLQARKDQAEIVLRDLKALKAAIDNRDGLDETDQKAAVEAALERYNDSVRVLRAGVEADSRALGVDVPPSAQSPR